MLGSWGWSNWVLFILAAVVVAAYFGVLAPVQERLEHFALVHAVNQPDVQQKFKDDGGRADAYVVVFLFMFLSPLAFFMAATIVIFLLSALSTMLAPVLGGERIALLVVTIVGVGVVYVERAVWTPHALYLLGLLARAYLVITTSA